MDSPELVLVVITLAATVVNGALGYGFFVHHSATGGAVHGGSRQVFCADAPKATLE